MTDPKRLHRMCEVWGYAKSIIEFGPHPAPSSIFGRIQDYGSGASSTRGEIRSEHEVLTGDALDVNCAIWVAMTPSLPRGKRLTAKQYAGLYVYYLPIEGEGGHYLTLQDKADRLGISKGTLQSAAIQARKRIAPFIGAAARESALQGIILRTAIR